MIIVSSLLESIIMVVVLLIQAAVLNIITEKKTIESRLIVSIFITAVFIFTTQLYESDMSIPLRLLCGFAHELLPCLLVLFSRKNFKLLDALIALIFQESCALIYSVVYIILPPRLVDFPYIEKVCKLIAVLAVLTAVVIAGRKIKSQNMKLGAVFRMIPNSVYIFILLSIFFESGIIVMISGYTTFDESGRYFTKILLFVFTAINVIIITSLIINVFYHKYQSNLNKLLKQQIDSQLSHYKKREDLNTEIRGFRHDFNNHVKCLESMMTMEKYDDAKAYLEKLTGMMPSAEFLFRTGNYVADAILTEIQEENKNITVKFSGVIPQSIDNADLCIVLSNAMNNAAEACGALSGNSTVSVYGNCQQGVFVLIVKNPTLQKGYAKNARHKTSKRDKIAHGFGLSNIQLVVKKYGGTMHTLLEDGMFTLSLTLSVEQAVYI